MRVVGIAAALIALLADIAVGTRTGPLRPRQSMSMRDHYNCPNMDTNGDVLQSQEVLGGGFISSGYFGSSSRCIYDSTGTYVYGTACPHKADCIAPSYCMAYGCPTTDDMRTANPIYN